MPVSDFLAREPNDLVEKVPCLLMVDSDNRLQKVVVDDKLVREARRCADAWHSLQELGGVHNSHAALLSNGSGKLGWSKPGEAKRKKQAARLPEHGRGPSTPAEAEVATERPSDDPFIETARCTSCNECTQINDKMFGYDANKQASIINPDAGTYCQLVEAAESCQVSIIHPGKPRNPNEPGLDELIKRAEPFL